MSGYNHYFEWDQAMLDDETEGDESAHKCPICERKLTEYGGYWHCCMEWDEHHKAQEEIAPPYLYIA